MAYSFGSAFLQQGNQVGLWLVRWGKPRHNGGVFEHIPEGCLQSLCELREGVIGGDRGFLETAYPVENFFVRERAVCIGKGRRRRAIRIAGQFEIAPGTMAICLR